MWNTRNKILAGSAAILVFFVILFFGIGRWKSSKEEKVGARVGVILPIGTTLEEGIAMERAIRLAAEEWNAKGGVRGAPVEIVSRDGNCDRGRARMAVEELVLRWRIPYLIGGLCENEARGILEGAGDRAIIISPVAANAALAEKDDAVFLLTPPRGGEMPALAEYLVKKLKKTNILLLFQDSELSRFSAEAFEKSIAAVGGRIAAKASFYPRTVEPENAVASVFASEGDAIFLISEIPAYTERMLAAIRKKYPDADVFVPTTTLERALDLVSFEGVLTVRPVSDINKKLLSDFQSRYEQRYGETVSFPAGQAAAYDALNLFLQVIDSKGYENVEKVREFIASTRRYEGVSGQIAFDAFGNAERSFEVVKNINGVLKSVQIFEP